MRLRELRESSAPVGSSASMSAGRPMTARAGGALTFSARQLGGEPVLRADYVERPRHLGDAPFRFRSRYGAQRERQRDVLVYGERVDEVVILEHKAQLRAAVLGERALVHGRDGHAVRDYRAAADVVHRRYQVEQSRFARAGRAHDGDELPFLHAERNAVQRLDRHAALAVYLHHVFQSEYLHACPPFPRGSPRLYLTTPSAPVALRKFDRTLRNRKVRKKERVKPRSRTRA